MTTALIYLLVMLLVAAVVFLLAALVFGRGEQLAPLAQGASPTRLPAEDITGDDVAAVKFQLTARGYKMSEVDWVIARLGGEIDSLRGRIADLETELDARAARAERGGEYPGERDGDAAQDGGAVDGGAVEGGAVEGGAPDGSGAAGRNGAQGVNRAQGMNRAQGVNRAQR
ncbi:DivIVA domain-containing protein [Prauserella isguenensis]|uniref:DivIVA domain-containing protein n=1 Tax=Prauserella isguenensis TaxID=1470180 RepID=A0A839S6C8_9PSEU|nr:DivIVA domain-containing protein [Prauserella isguenensis]